MLEKPQPLFKERCGTISRNGIGAGVEELERVPVSLLLETRACHADRRQKSMSDKLRKNDAPSRGSRHRATQDHHAESCVSAPPMHENVGIFTASLHNISISSNKRPTAQTPGANDGACCDRRQALRRDHCSSGRLMCKSQQSGCQWSSNCAICRARGRPKRRDPWHWQDISYSFWTAA